MHEQAVEALERSRSSLNVLICAGTGCIASGSMKVYENLREECAQRGLQVYVGLTHHGDAEKSLHIKMVAATASARWDRWCISSRWV
ncbi:MAG: (2Fe-2S) ferredoxin domain-containing protein [Dysosmobacter sp.]